MREAQAEYYRALKARLEAADFGGRGAIISEAEAFMGVSRDTVYRTLRTLGFESGRRKRKDAGKLCVGRELAMLAGGMIKAATRDNGKKTLPLTTTREILRDNGLGVPDADSGEITMPHPATLSRAMRRYGCHPAQTAAGSPALRLRSPHPNHTWEMDASVCIIFYLGEDRDRAGGRGRVRIMEEKLYNKNKPKNLEKVEKQRVIRWVITDHASGALFVRYRLGAEDAASAIEVLIECMCRREAEHDIFHGAPLQLYTDKGAPFVAGLMKEFCRRLGIKLLNHERGNARATGQVENGQNIVETQFEGRLYFMDVRGLDQLNASAAAWQIKWNATAVHSRHRRTRNQMWLGITREQLRVPESAEALRAVAASPAVPRKVPQDLVLGFSHRKLGRHRYSLAQVPGLFVGQTILVSFNPFEAPAVDVTVTDEKGAERVYTLQPLKTDRYGFMRDAPVIGGEFKARADTGADKARKEMLLQAYGASTQEEAEAAKKSRRRVYEGINPMADVEQAHRRLAEGGRRYLPFSGSALEAGGAKREIPDLTPFEAAKRLRAALASRGVGWSDGYMRRLQELGSIPAASLDGLALEFAAASGGNAGPDAANIEKSGRTGAEVPLRLVVGGSL